jgi:hypothetical protein
MLKTILRYVLLTLTAIAGFLLIFILIAVAPVDETPAKSLPSYEKMMGRLDAIEIDIPRARKGFSVGFGKVNITPRSPVSTAGYGKRRGKAYLHVHDSIYVRTMVIDNGAAKVAIVSADLLIMPPAVTRILDQKLSAIGFSLNNTYLGATHSHNSIGHWGEGATRFIYGAYEDSVVHFIADAIVNSIRKANEDLLPSVIMRGSVAIPDAVQNRLIDGGEEDPYLRVIEVHRSDSTKNILLSFAAHATCLSQGTLELSRDYPGMLVDNLETRGYSFAMFLAGAVGSHKGSSPVNDFGCVKWMSEQIADAFLAGRKVEVVKDSALVMARVPLSLSEPQVKISENWKVRSWLFRAAFGEYKSFLTVLRIGDVVMLGTPCDFSGEFNASLASAADSIGVDHMVTSFNGGYIGYVTPGKYYDVDHYETRLMNWYAPGTGDYMQECLKKLMYAVSDTN